MKKLISLIILFFCSTLVGATVDNSTSSSSITRSTATSSVNLVSEINKKTKQGLEAFKGLTKDDQQSKDDFFDTVGQSPTSADFEGQTGEDVVVQRKFKFSDEND